MSRILASGPPKRFLKFTSSPAVRLEGEAQKDRLGDLVVNMPVNYPDPAPSIDWSDGKLVVTLADNEKYQYLENPVDGVLIDVQRK